MKRYHHKYVGVDVHQDLNEVAIEKAAIGRPGRAER